MAERCGHGWEPSGREGPGTGKVPATMIDEIRRIQGQSQAQIDQATSPDALAEVEPALTGKGSELLGLKKGLGALDPDARRETGLVMNEASEAIRTAIAAKRDLLAAAAQAQLAEAERLDLTEVRAHRDAGHLHLVTQAIEEL